MAFAFDVATAAFAMVASVFWFFSAARSVPNVAALSDQPLLSYEFCDAVQFSSKMNRWAAGFSGLSALVAACKIAVL
jgi:hypothetical protein